MKKCIKYICLFFIFIFLFISNVKADDAKEVKEFKCYYNIRSMTDEFTIRIYIHVKNYKQSNGTGSAKLYYAADETGDFGSYSGSFTKNTDDIKYKIYLFKKDSNLSSYISKYTPGYCPSIYRNYDFEDDEDIDNIAYYIDTEVDDSYDMNTYHASSEGFVLLDGESDFISNYAFREQAESTLKCSYTVNSKSVSFTKNTNNGNVSYVAKVGSDETNVIDTTVDFKLGGVTIIRDTVTKVFANDGCIEMIKKCNLKEDKSLAIGPDGSVERFCDGLIDVPTDVDIDPGDVEVDDEEMTCQEILGPVGNSILKGALKMFRIVGALIAIVNGMIIVVPAVAAHDADALKKSTKKLTVLAIILLIVLVFGPLVKVLGGILEFDASCIV